MLKSNRNYQAVFYIKDKKTNQEEVIVIQPPFAVDFEVSFGLVEGQHTCFFQFYNLSYDDQRKLWKDYFNIGDKEIRLHFFAGYGKTEDLPLLCSVDILRCTSQRTAGSVDVVTTVETVFNDLYSSFAFCNMTFEKGSKYNDILSALIDKLPISVGYVSDDLGELPNSRTYIGNAIDLIKSEFGRHNVFVGQDELNVLKDTEIIPSEIQVISEETGMLGTPKISNVYLQVDMMFEPNLKLFQVIYLNSTYRLIKSQPYKVYSISHRGTISNVTSANVVTTVMLEYINENIKNNEAKKPLQQKEEQKAKEQAKTSYNWIKPVEGRVTSKYGYRVAPLPGASKDHKGIDIGCNPNAPIKAPANGTVTSSSYDNVNGNLIRINHGNGIVSAYAHLNQRNVAIGQKVNQGDIIGLAGSTGKSTGTHLHFGVKKNDKYVNPNDFVRYY